MTNFLFSFNAGDLNFLCDILMMSAMMSLLWSSNNIVMLLNFLAILMLLSFKLLIAGVMEFTIVMIMVYQSAVMILFLVNSLHLVNLFSFSFNLLSCVMLWLWWEYFFGDIIFIFLCFGSKIFYVFWLISRTLRSLSLVWSICSWILLGSLIMVLMTFALVIWMMAMFIGKSYRKHALLALRIMTIIYFFLLLVA